MYFEPTLSERYIFHHKDTKDTKEISDALCVLRAESGEYNKNGLKSNCNYIKKFKMQSIRVRSRIGKNGIVQIQLPEVTEGAELDMIVVYESASTARDTRKMSDFFYGWIQDETFVRHPQPEQPERETF